MNMNRKTLRVTACCMAAAVTLCTVPSATFGAGPVAGASALMSATLDNEAITEIKSTSAGISLKVADCVSAAAEMTAAGQAETLATTEGANISETSAQSTTIPEGKVPAAGQAEESAAEKSEYADIAIAQVDNYVNVRDAASEEGNVVGKLYNNSAATVHATEDGWYQITSGNVTGYVKSEFVVCGDEELAKQVSRRVATVQTETLFVRTEPTTESDVLEMVPDQEELTVIDESVDGWTKVSLEAGEGYVSNDFITKSVEFVTAESKEEEEARLAKEEEEREAAAKAAEKSESSKSASLGKAAAPSGSGGSAVANYACQFVGNPYVYGGTSLTNGADCSGFVMSVYAAFGVGLPHSSSAMRGVGYGVSTAEMQPGDIVCYSGHVAIYIGNNTIVHASTPASGIKYTSPIDYKPILAVRRIF